jgi:heme/copper-type cytochrome/quinol oxidase subunit 2
MINFLIFWLVFLASFYFLFKLLTKDDSTKKQLIWKP